MSGRKRKDRKLKRRGARVRRGRAARLAGAIAVAVFCILVLSATSAYAAPPEVSGVAITEVSASTATLKASIDPEGKATTFTFFFGEEDCSKATCGKALAGSIAAAGSKTTKEVLVEGLQQGVIYHFLLAAKNADGEILSKDHAFVALAPVFSGLPDDRAYEQASPTNKNGGDVLGDVPTVKAARDGGGITFASTFGIPGGKGAQETPSYLATRGSSNWSTQGLLPPPLIGQRNAERAQVIGWSPDYTEVFSEVTELGTSRESALVMQSTLGGAPIPITPYEPNTDYFYVGQSKDGSIVIFESKTALTPAAHTGISNLYAWDRNTGQISLVDVLNPQSEGEEPKPPKKGGLAGPYEWTEGINSQSLRLGGSFRGFYLQDERAIAPDGSIYFTEVGTGQLYERLRPAKVQSPLNGQGECEVPSLACTVHVSASQKSNGAGEEGRDSTGSQPVAFQAASQDGKEVFFTSHEKLTNDANTGPEQPLARIERDDLSGGTVETPDFIPKKGVGVAVDGDHVYWANPALRTIGRANLDGTAVEEDFMAAPPVLFKFEREIAPGVFEEVEEEVPSEPRYVALGNGHVYWTSTGRRDEFGPVDGEGTIGQAKLEGEEAVEVNPAFIRGASNPQGIAVNAEHIYWANATRDANGRAVAQATIGGDESKFRFFEVRPLVPTGVVLTSAYVYFGLDEIGNSNGYVSCIPLGGGKEESLFVGNAGIRGLAADGFHIYWTTQGEEAIGRANLELEAASREKEFIKLSGKPNGLAV